MELFELAVNGNITAVKVRRAASFFSRAFGLIGKNSSSTGLFIPQCSSIHTFFMKVPIDAVFADRQGKVLDVRAHLKPWRIVLPVAGAVNTVELEAGTVGKLGIKPGDILTTVNR